MKFIFSGLLFFIGIILIIVGLSSSSVNTNNNVQQSTISSSINTNNNAQQPTTINVDENSINLTKITTKDNVYLVLCGTALILFSLGLTLIWVFEAVYEFSKNTTYSLLFLLIVLILGSLFVAIANNSNIYKEELIIINGQETKKLTVEQKERQGLFFTGIGLLIIFFISAIFGCFYYKQNKHEKV